MRQSASSGSPLEPIIGFSRAVRVGNIAAVAGTAPIGTDGKTVGLNDAAVQMRRCLEISRDALAAIGVPLESVVRTRILLTRIEDWEVVARVHGEFFAGIKPVTTVMQVVGFVNPEWIVETEMDAFVDAVMQSDQQFNAHATKYATSAVHRLGPSLPVMLELAAPQKQDFALDVATGTGNTAFVLAPFVTNVIGLDIASKMLDQARKRAFEESQHNASFIKGSAEQLPFADHSFSLVTSRHAPHHFCNVPTFLSEVSRVLRLDGRFVMADQITLEAGNQTWIDAFQTIRDPSHFKQRSMDEWQELARVAGFTWVSHQIVPYRLEFDWWTKQSGCTPQQIMNLTQMLLNAPAEIQLERNLDGSPLAHFEPMLVVRLEKY